jgi:c(7)-type cytochrome triheme protein
MNIRQLELGKWPKTGCLCALALMFLLTSSTLAAPGDVDLKRKDDAGSGFPVSVFPHWVHRINYRCDACHTRLFEMKAGTLETSMAEINAGQACGTCHDGKKAFAAGFNNCNRCHVPKASE